MNKDDSTPKDPAEDGFELPVNPHPVLRYTVLRLAIFAIALGLLWLVRVRGLLLVALAVLVSGLASYALLQRERDAMSARIAQTSARRKARAASRAAREDEIADELAREQAPAEDVATRPRS
ncbi:MAG TPA: DUF4229 domain-containing protein [Acidothermaceae bacterium]